MKRKSKKRRTRVRGKENKRNTKRNTKRNKRGGMRFMRRQSDDPNELTRRENMRQELDERMRVIERDEENIRVRARAALDINDYDELMKIALRGTQKKIEKIRLQIYIANNERRIVSLSRGGTDVDEASELIGDGSQIPEWDLDEL
tara:strand:+ start:266 stop:703 length:438 start_codon:yes stop_codon:yes gene_type:complete